LAARNESVAVFGKTSVAEDRVTPRWLQVPKWDSATASGQRSAAQKGQDSSLTNTMAGFPAMLSTGQTRGLQRMAEDDKANFVLSHLGSAPGRRALGRPAPAGAVDAFAHPPLPGPPRQDGPGRRPLRSEG
jgi:hypothetical protein